MKRVPSMWIAGVTVAGGILVSSIVSGVAVGGAGQVAWQDHELAMAEDSAAPYPQSIDEARLPPLSR